jgi:colicin import membrane protein
VPRPQKYTDPEIVAAIEFLSAAGEIVNPMRVRMRLGGGNMTRIKAIIVQRLGQLAQTTASVVRPPDHVSKEFQRLSGEVSQQILLLANSCWIAASGEAASMVGAENVQLRGRIQPLESDNAAAASLVGQVEAERDRRNRDLTIFIKERDQFEQECRDLKAALRNAESDLRATKRMIESFERNQLQDRSEVRQLQKRIEELVAELATLKANTLKTDASRKISGLCSAETRAARSLPKRQSSR